MRGRSVADFTIGQILALTRKIARADEELRRGVFTAPAGDFGSDKDVIWDMNAEGPWQSRKGIEMEGKTIGLIGFGAVAQLVYEKLKGFGCRFLISDPFYSGKINKNIAKFVPLEQLLENSDIVSLHARLSRKSILLGEKEFKSMKNTAYFINTARSYMVDYAALADALKNGEIMGAAIDVFDVEQMCAEEQSADVFLVCRSLLLNKLAKLQHW